MRAVCGITGIITTDGLAAEECIAIDVMSARLSHRGPDDTACHIDSHAALAHRRLAIVDLHTGRQPVFNETGEICAVLNGEIYNFRDLRDPLLARGHRLTTAGDAEPIVHLYEDAGPVFLDSLRGMFAIALWDRRSRTALLARDRLGVKPLYYHVDDRRLIFASELKAILASPNVPARLDPAALLDYLTYGYIPAPRTIYCDIHKLPPGHLLTYREGRADVRSYWDLRYTSHFDASPEQVADQLWHELQEATRLRMIADVPLGAFLSGGLDSTAVVAAMAGLSTDPVLTRTCGFHESGFDERPHAHAVAAHLNANHAEIPIRAADADLLDTIAWHFDEPFADASAIPMFHLCRTAKRDMTVALSGDGGDEILAGYRRYRFDVNEDAARRVLPAAVRRGLIAPLASIYPHADWLPRPLRARATLRNLSLDGVTAHAASVATLQPDAARALLNADYRAAVHDYNPFDRVREHYARCDAPDHLSKCQYVDIRMGLGDGILTKVDRASMAHAVEVRSPMLDYRFVEFAWRIPPKLRRRGALGKLPLRHAVADRLGPQFIRTKAGFEVPIDAWLAGPLRERLMDEMLASAAPIRDLLDIRAVDTLWQEHSSGRRRHGPTLWKLAMLSAWIRSIHLPGSAGVPPAGAPQDALLLTAVARSLACTP